MTIADDAPWIEVDYSGEKNEYFPPKFAKNSNFGGTFPTEFVTHLWPFMLKTKITSAA